MLLSFARLPCYPGAFFHIFRFRSRCLLFDAYVVSDEFKYSSYFLANMPIAFFNISISSSSFAFFFNKFLCSTAVIVVFLSTETGLFFFTQPVIVDFDTAYSLFNSARLFPEL